MNIARKFQYDTTYMNIAETMAKLSYAQRNKVGAVIVSENGQLISQGFNGTPTGTDNCCEYTDDNGNLVTKDEVLHAESNALSKCARFGGASSEKSTIYVTLSPCINCAKLIIQAGVKRVVFKEIYRDLQGIKLLVNTGVEVNMIDENTHVLNKLGWNQYDDVMTVQAIPIDKVETYDYIHALSGSAKHNKYRDIRKIYFGK